MAIDPTDHEPVWPRCVYDPQTRLVQVIYPHGGTADYADSQWHQLVDELINDPGTWIVDGEQQFYDPAQQRPVIDDGSDRLVDLTLAELDAHHHLRDAAHAHPDHACHRDVLTAYAAVLQAHATADYQRWEDQRRRREEIARIELAEQPPIALVLDLDGFVDRVHRFGGDLAAVRATGAADTVQLRTDAARLQVTLSHGVDGMDPADAQRCADVIEYVIVHGGDHRYLWERHDPNLDRAWKIAIAEHGNDSQWSASIGGEDRFPDADFAWFQRTSDRRGPDFDTVKRQRFAAVIAEMAMTGETITAAELSAFEVADSAYLFGAYVRDHDRTGPLSSAHQRAHALDAEYERALRLDRAAIYIDADADGQCVLEHDPWLRERRDAALSELFAHLRRHRDPLEEDPRWEGHYAEVDYLDHPPLDAVVALRPSLADSVEVVAERAPESPVAEAAWTALQSAGPQPVTDRPSAHQNHAPVDPPVVGRSTGEGLKL